MRTMSEIKRKYSLDENYFEKIDTQDKAYWLGFLYADGYNNEKKGAISVRLAEVDIKILEDLKFYLKSGHPIFFINNDERNKRDNSNLQNHVSLDISRRKLSEDLAKLGCVQKKSLILKFPTHEQVPDDLIRHFLRGYFDGDGSLSISTKKDRYKCCYFCIASSSIFCDSLKNLIDNNFNIICKSSIINNNKLSKKITIGGKRKIYRFLDWIYKDSTIYLERKYKIYLENRPTETFSYNERAIKQIDPITKNIIHIWNSAKEAAITFTNNPNGNDCISRICRKYGSKNKNGRIYTPKTIYGFEWEYIFKNSPEYLEFQEKNKPPVFTEGLDMNKN